MFGFSNSDKILGPVVSLASVDVVDAMTRRDGATVILVDKGMFGDIPQTAGYSRTIGGSQHPPIALVVQIPAASPVFVGFTALGGMSLTEEARPTAIPVPICSGSRGRCRRQPASAVADAGHLGREFGGRFYSLIGVSPFGSAGTGTKTSPESGTEWRVANFALNHAASIPPSSTSGKPNEVAA